MEPEARQRDLEVSADGYTETLSLSVRAGSFSYKDYSKTSPDGRALHRRG